MEKSVVSLSRRPRAGGPKVRTGCITCKIRRVKCDERQPSCLRCLKFGVTCDGYLPLKPRTASRPHRAVVLKERPLYPLAPKNLPNIAISHAPSNAPFADDQEYRYFRLFCDKTASSLAGYFNSSLWTQLVLQACEDAPPIRNAIIAIGALDKTLDTTQSWRSSLSSNAGEVMTEGLAHHQFAFQQYGKAVKRMKDSIATGVYDYRKALILCLLTVCFEALNGDMQSAVTQVRNGLRLIREWNQARAANKSNAFGTSELGSMELIRAFNRLDNDSIMIADAEPAIAQPVSLESDGPDQRIPYYFSSVEEAQALYEMLLSEMFHWVAGALAWGSRNDETRNRQQISETMKDRVIQQALSRKMLMEGREYHLQRFNQWRAAFEPLWIHSRTPAGRKDFTAATAIELRFKATYTSQAANYFLGDCGYDAFEADFQKVVDLAKLLLANEKTDDMQRAIFTFEDSIVSGLYIVILKCRHPIIRREAIEILESRPRRDGVMDGALMAKIGRIQMDIEEAENEGGYIPEHARIRGIKTTYNMAKHTGQMKYLKMVSSSSPTFAMHLVEFTW